MKGITLVVALVALSLAVFAQNMAYGTVTNFAQGPYQVLVDESTNMVTADASAVGGPVHVFQYVEPVPGMIHAHERINYMDFSLMGWESTPLATGMLTARWYVGTGNSWPLTLLSTDNGGPLTYVMNQGGSVIHLTPDLANNILTVSEPTGANMFTLPISPDGIARLDVGTMLRLHFNTNDVSAVTEWVLYDFATV